MGCKYRQCKNVVKSIRQVIGLRGIVKVHVTKVGDNKYLISWDIWSIGVTRYNINSDIFEYVQKLKYVFISISYGNKKSTGYAIINI